jgi:hypothetical protein
MQMQLWLHRSIHIKIFYFIIINEKSLGEKCDKKVDYCSQNPCESFQKCKDFNDSYFCEGECNSTGLIQNKNGRCIDVDECINPGEYCPKEAKCENLYGSFNCICPSGYTYDLNSRICQGMCLFVRI